MQSPVGAAGLIGLALLPAAVLPRTICRLNGNVQRGLSITHFHGKYLPAVPIGISNPDFVLEREATIYIHLIPSRQPCLREAFFCGKYLRAVFYFHTEVIQGTPLADFTFVVYCEIEGWLVDRAFVVARFPPH